MSNYVYDSLVLALPSVVRFHVFESISFWPLFSLGRVDFSSFDIGPMLGRCSPDELSFPPDIGSFGADDGSFSADDVIVSGNVGGPFLLGSMSPGSVGWPSRPRPSYKSSYSTSLAPVLCDMTYSISTSLSK